MFKKTAVRSLEDQTRNGNFVETGFSDRTDFVVVRHLLVL
jgi:hypothetical protein